MTVKGNMKLNLEEVPPLNHKNSKIPNGSQPVSNSPPKDSNLNHYRAEKVIAVSITDVNVFILLILQHIGICNILILSNPDNIFNPLINYSEILNTGCLLNCKL